MGCVSSSSQINNLSNQPPQIYIQFNYCGSCGWAKLMNKLYKQYQKHQILNRIPLDICPIEKVTKTVKINIVQNQIPQNIYTGNKQNCDKDKQKIINMILENLKQRQQNKLNKNNIAEQR